MTNKYVVTNKYVTNKTVVTCESSGLCYFFGGGFGPCRGGSEAM